MNSTDKMQLRKMRKRIDQLERLTMELKEIGQNFPVVDKNCRNILSATYILKFGISDIADIEAS